VNSRHDDLSLVTAIAPCTGKIIKNAFERGDNCLQNGILHFVFMLSQSSEIVLQRHIRKSDFSERGLALKGLRGNVP